jgi:hypothetical protein
MGTVNGRPANSKGPVQNAITSYDDGRTTEREPEVLIRELDGTWHKVPQDKR